MELHTELFKGKTDRLHISGDNVWVADAEIINSMVYESPLAFHYVKDGRLEMRIGKQRRVLLSSGDIMMVPPKSQVLAASHGPVTSVSVFFNDTEALVESLFGNESVSKNCAFQYLVGFYALHKKNAHGELRRYLDGVTEIPCSFEMESVLDEVRRIIRKEWNLYFGKKQLVRRKRISTRMDIAWKVEDIRMGIEAACTQKFNLSSTSRKSLMSKFAMIRNFKEVVGMTPHQYHIHQRIRLAKEYLKGNLPVKEVAQKCGYPDIFSFSKQFKMIEGYPPSQYLQRMASWYQGCQTLNQQTSI